MPNPLINIGSAANSGDGEVGPRAWLQKINRLPNPDRTYNAGSGDYVGTIEQKITAAIAQAVAEGGTSAAPRWVFVPESMLPYAAASVTFNTGIKMLREGCNPSFIDILAYGADSGGTIDSRAAIQAALNRAAVLTDGIVYMPGGNYSVSGNLTVAAAVSIYGEGMDVTTLRYTPTTGDALTVSGTSGAHNLKHEFVNFTINAVNISTGTGLNGTWMTYSRMRGVRILNFAIGMTLASSFNNHYDGCQWDHNTQDGVNLGLDTNASTFSNCDLSNNNRAGAFVLGSRGTAFINSSFQSNGTGGTNAGLYITADAADTTSGISVTACYFEGQLNGPDILISSADAGTTKPAGITILGNNFQPLSLGTTDAIQINYCDGCRIHGNFFSNKSGWSYSHSVFLSANVTTDIAMEGNVDRSTNGIIASAGLIMVRTGTGQTLLGKLQGANFNITTDQAIPVLFRGNYRVTEILAVDATGASMTTAVGGFYNNTGKPGGGILVAASQVYTALTTAGKMLACTLAGVALTDRQSAQTLYLSLTTPQGAAATADVYVYGEPIN